jgi:hypothetical protein
MACSGQETREKEKGKGKTGQQETRITGSGDQESRKSAVWL